MKEAAFPVKVSVIVPVFNVQKYLDKALASVACQTLDNYEVVIVNDGSTDESIKIINDYLNRHDNFSLIVQKNSGLSMARNAGLKKAVGEFVTFFDSDDFIQSDFLEKMYNACKENNADIAYCAHYIYIYDRRIRFFMPFTAKTGVLEKEKAFNKLLRDLTLHFFAWNKMYRRSLFTEHNIEFPSMFFEDIATTFKPFFYANKVAIIHKPLYNYTKRKGSILRTMNVKKINDYTLSIGLIRNFLEKENVFPLYRRSVIIFGIRMMICNYYSIIRTHILALNFRGFAKNIRASDKSLIYFMGKDFKVTDKVEVLYPVKLPEEKKRKDNNNT